MEMISTIDQLAATKVPPERQVELARADAEERAIIIPFRLGSLVKHKNSGGMNKVDAITIYENGRISLCFHDVGRRMQQFDEWSEGDVSEYEKYGGDCECCGYAFTSCKDCPDEKSHESVIL